MSDKSSTVSYLNRGPSSISEAIKWLKLLFYASGEFDSVVSARHVLGVDNKGADSLSRATEELLC